MSKKSYIYRDMEFCPYWKECKFGNMCPKVLKNDEYEKVMYNYVIAFLDKKPSCFKEKR